MRGYPLRYDLKRHCITVLNSSELIGKDFFSILNSDEIKKCFLNRSTTPRITIKTVGRNDEGNLEFLFKVKSWNCYLGMISSSFLDEITYSQTKSGLLLIQ